MIQVDFYILKPDYPKDMYQFTCSLVEKIYTQGLRSYIHLGSDNEAEHINQLLWTFRQGSFIPHGLLGSTDQKITPVLLGTQQCPDGNIEVLVNLTYQIPESFEHFHRIAEVINQDPERLNAGRERFRRYRELGHTLKTHEMTK